MLPSLVPTLIPEALASPLMPAPLPDPHLLPQAVDPIGVAAPAAASHDAPPADDAR